jgi:hypothetical protein
MFNFTRGATFQLAASFQVDGDSVDCSGWTLTVQIRSHDGDVLIATPIVTWLDQTNGLLTLSVTDTSAWPVGRARIDAVFVDGSGANRASDTEYFRIVESPIYG